MSPERPKSAPASIESGAHSTHPLADTVREKIAKLPPESPLAEHSLRFLNVPSDEVEAKHIRQTHNVLQQLAEGRVNPDTLEPSILKELEGLGAIDEKRELTEIGLEIAVLPFEPRFARMIVKAQKRDCLEPTLVMTSFISVGDVFADDKKKKGKKGNIRAARTLFNRGNSDWLTSLNIFEQAVDHGLFESLEGNTDHTVEFKRWCEENQLQSESLKKAAQQLVELAQIQELDLKTDPRSWRDLCRLANAKDLTAVILSGNSDRLFSEDPHASRGGEKIYSAAFSSEWAYGCPENTHCNPAEDYFVAGSIKDLGDGKYKENMALQLHPVSISDIVEVLPHLVETAPVQGFSYRRPVYDPQNDRTLSLNSVRKKNDPSGIFSLGQAWQPMTVVTGRDKELAAEAFLDYLLGDKTKHDILPFLEQNRDTLRRLEHLYHCAKHDLKYDPPNLRRWYQERLKDCASVSDILDAGLLEGEALNLTVEEVWKDPESLAEYNRKYPAEFHFQGKTIPITYRRPFSSRFSEARLTATFDLSNLTIEELLLLKYEDIPHISNENFNTDLAFFTQINLHPTHGVGVESNLCNLQSEIKNLVVFAQWISTQSPVVIPMNPQWRVLPTVEALGFKPKEIGHRSDGFPVVVYPEIKPVFDGSHGFSHFAVSYTLREDVVKAGRSFAETEFGRQRRFLDSAEKRAEAERIRQKFRHEYETTQTVGQARGDTQDRGTHHERRRPQNTNSGRGKFGTLAEALEEALKKKGK